MVLEPIGRLFWRRTSSFCFVPQPSAFLVGALLYPLVRVIVSQHKVFRALGNPNKQRKQRLLACAPAGKISLNCDS